MLKRVIMNTVIKLVLGFFLYASSLLMEQSLLMAVEKEQQVSIENCSETDANQEFTCDVLYKSSDNSKASGLGFRLHYDGVKLDWLSLESTLQDGLLATSSQPEVDANDLDQDVKTSHYINSAWATLDTQWPNKALPTKLYTVRLKAKDNINTDENLVLRLTTTGASNGYSLVSTAYDNAFPDTQENNVPNTSGSGTGDGDGDGTADNIQNNVTSLKNHDDRKWLTYRNNSGRVQRNFITKMAPKTAPKGRHLLHGVTEFEIETSLGETITIELYVERNEAITDYLLFGNDGKWYPMNATITHEGNKTKIVFTITQGGNFDRSAKLGALGGESATLQLAEGGAVVDTGLGAWPYAYLFGNVELGQQTEAKAFTLKNTGSRDLTISNASITGNNAGEFSVTDNTCTTLTANETCTISASFQPNSIGSKSAMLTVATDDPDNANINIFLRNHEADKEESERRLPPVLNSFTIKNQAGKEVSTMQSNTQYTVHWSILGYHESYTSLVVMFNCTGIADNTSCGDSYSDSSRFLTSGTVTSSSSENGIWFHGDVQSKIFNYSHTFTTPDYATSTTIVIRFYRKNSKDLQVGNGSLSLIIPGNQAENYYDTTGRRVKNVISP